jgi:hypothetical protein
MSRSPPRGGVRVGRGKSSSYWEQGKDGTHGYNDCWYVCTGGTTPIRKLNE